MAKEKELSGVPLDKLKIDVITKTGDIKRVSALHIGFTEERQFICYRQPPNYYSSLSNEADTIDSVKIKARIEEWLERMEFLEEDLHWLLHLPAHRFWSQIIYDESLQKCLESYLCYAPRYHDVSDSLVTEEMKTALQRIHRLVFMVFLRLSTYKESKSVHFTPQAFADIIYENFLFDIPKIMDLCVLYGRGNRNLLQKMIKNIFEWQPKYLDDLAAAIPTILEVFDTIENKLGLDYITELENNNEPKKLDEALTPVSTFTWNKLKDLIFYLVDTSATLNAFLDIYPQAAESFHKQGTAVRISNFYEIIFLPLTTELKNRSKDEQLKDLIAELTKRIYLAKTCLIKSFREIIFYCCLQPILDRQVTNAEVFLQIMSICVSDKCFISDYQEVFPFEEDIELLSQASVTLDSTSIDYILSGIYSSYELLGKPIVYKTVPIISSVNSAKQSNEINQIPESLPNSEICSDSVLDGACATPKLEGVELDSLVTQVLDVLGHLGEGFVEQCLEYYNYDAEKVISALLDDTLPSSLNKLDRSMKSTRKSSILSSRKNIYDNDEFDVFSTDKIDKSRIHKGKREDKLLDINIVLKQDKNASALREIYQKYDVIEETDDTLYEDEYDDTYDDRNLGPEEPPSPDDMLYKRPIRTPRVLEKGDCSDDDNSSPSISEKSEQASSSIHRIADEFVANPAELRKKEEERIQEMRRHHDVKGKPRGQGQDKTTLRNREYKEKHKSSVANHNRRFQSDKKRQRGMFPT
ncbi:activating signal cointegrator 1 complex subunit 2-like isoform X1 [Centruroides sculpturatus]|uniref:activating signal cointegrator 1 complex subunit 2-like isoform X1 n=3 Tax=Centruroides sculpturatus TaxID=218467 RepID=UPI000C6DA7A2|nr:activating signal cointegrator 1 complex subunit 2-like isoform X1 [Centruroides sculpturatus]XP_023216587.1 activating signal cointegrator 1 complex subunit 2-like isoform X1 [Centruroides sculpturatus]XP_023216590.1 activating signal cointegrator 1 complex subunit 2-like isoform X1 [Centruroides sculpturatus]